MRVFLVVIDGFGIGQLPDAKEFDDEGSNTYLHLVQNSKIFLPVLTSLGLNSIDGVELPYKAKLKGSFGRMKELTFAKDSTAGHYEIAGIVMKDPYPTFPKGFPKEFVKELENACGCKFLGNEVASGTEIISRLGQKHVKTKKPILYTSADSVLQIAAHEEIFGLEKLYEVCKKAREVAKNEFNVSRIIARPFIGTKGNFTRTKNRRDYALLPPEKSMLDKMKEAEYKVFSIGKIDEIFCGQGITQKIEAKTNDEVLNSLIKVANKNFRGLVFVNLCDTDTLFGHRNDPQGYADSLMKIDEKLLEFLPELSKNDILIITADHGCDPVTKSTDHSREYVPLLIYGKGLKAGVNLGTLNGFNNISKSILDYFCIEKYKGSFIKKLMD